MLKTFTHRLNVKSRSCFSKRITFSVGLAGSSNTGKGSYKLIINSSNKFTLKHVIYHYILFVRNAPTRRLTELN
jgi:hypothetical protein